ncbi:pyridoxal-phosphate dependent enzyme [Nocardia sp. NPDC051321]|uniref:pyridoxal-phosphate dependent enzyme n=1 Tax=Nocardia sp. NPDC051321 TaxID=3364323 RepID=UPI0037B219DD
MTVSAWPAPSWCHREPVRTCPQSLGCRTQRWCHITYSVQSIDILAVVGCSPFGIEYFKGIAHEIVTMHGRMPDAMVIPSSRGDLAHGIYRGFTESGRGMPRLYLVEPFPRLHAVLEQGADLRTTFGGETQLLPSIAGDTTTRQSVVAAAGSDGGAVVVSGLRMPRSWWRPRVASKGCRGETKCRASRLTVHRRRGARSAALSARAACSAR